MIISIQFGHFSSIPYERFYSNDYIFSSDPRLRNGNQTVSSSSSSSSSSDSSRSSTPEPQQHEIDSLINFDADDV